MDVGKPWPKPRTESRWNPRIPAGSEFGKKFFRIGSRLAPPQGTFAPRLQCVAVNSADFVPVRDREFFVTRARNFSAPAGNSSIGTGKRASASRPINMYRFDTGRVS